MQTYPIIVAAAVALASLAVPARAEILAAKARIGSYSIPDGISPVQLDDKGNSSLTFTKTSKKSIVVITYNAECSATGDPGAWVGLEIRVNGKLINPKADMSDFAFCSSSGATQIYTAVTRQGFVKLGPGEHTVQVVVSKQGVETGRIDDGSIVIEE